LSDELKGEIRNQKPTIWLDCLEYWESHIGWETIIWNCMLDEPK